MYCVRTHCVPFSSLVYCVECTHTLICQVPHTCTCTCKLFANVHVHTLEMAVNGLFPPQWPHHTVVPPTQWPHHPTTVAPPPHHSGPTTPPQWPHHKSFMRSCHCYMYVYIHVHVPLCWGSVHDDVDPEDLHGVEWVRETHHCGQSDQCQGRYTPVWCECEYMDIHKHIRQLIIYASTIYMCRSNIKSLYNVYFHNG